MFSKIAVVLAALLSNLDPSAVEVHDLAARIGLTQADAGEVLAAVQIDLLPDNEGAETLAAELELRLAARGSKLSVFVEPVVGDAELPPSYRVVVGPFEAFDEAEQARLELARLGVDGFVREFSSDPLGC